MEKYNITIICDTLSANDALTPLLSKRFDLEVTTHFDKEVHTETPNLILLNQVENPEKLVKSIRKTKNLFHTPICLLIDNIEASQIDILLDQGVNDIIHTPLHPSLLLKKLTNLAQVQIKSSVINDFMMLDEITGLANKDRFKVQLKTEWARAERSFSPIALLIINIQNFKRINQIDGITKGDSILRIVGGILKGNTKRPADFVSRLDDDRFAVLLPETEDDGAAVLAGNILHQIHNEPLLPDDFSIRIGISCTTPLESDQLQDFVNKARIASEKAKKTPENPIHTIRLEHF